MEKFNKLVNIIKTLRGPDGCEWDKSLDLKSVKSYLKEEAYEAYQAIIDNDHDAIKEEMGDLLMEIILITEIETELGNFDINDVLEAINEKMIRRHPHVFGDKKTKDIKKILTLWENEKRKEKKHRESYLEGIPDSLPTIMRAFKLQERAARVGFDWDNYKEVVPKLDEENRELKAELKKYSKSIDNDNNEDKEKALKGIEGEIGDMMFVLVNLSRKLNINPDEALILTNMKFKRRFQYIENRLKQSGKSLFDTELDEMEEYWQECKKYENG